MITRAGKKVVVEIDQDAERAADDAGCWSGHAATILDAINTGISSGHLSANDGFLISLSEVCARAFRSVADDEGERLQGLTGRDATMGDAETWPPLAIRAGATASPLKGLWCGRPPRAPLR